MKKRIISVVIAAILVVFPFKVFAQVEETNLQDTLTAENIKISDKTYKENDDQVTVYLFRGQGCGHCEELLNYLNTIIPKYKDKFKLKAYEVWYNEDNHKLQEKVAKSFNVDASGVPFLIIGKKTFIGFQESDKSKIVDAINKEYSAKKRYDIMKEINTKKAKKNDALFVIIPVLIIGVVLYLTRSSEDDETVNVDKNDNSKSDEKIVDTKKVVKAKKTTSDEKPASSTKKSTAKKSTEKKSTTKKTTTAKTQTKAKTTKKTTKSKK